MSIKTKEGIDKKKVEKKAPKQPEKVKARFHKPKQPVDLRMNTRDWYALEEQATSKMYLRIALQSNRTVSSDFELLASKIDKNKLSTIFYQDLGQSMSTDDGHIAVSARLQTLAMSKYGVIAHYTVSIDNRLLGDVTSVPYCSSLINERTNLGFLIQPTVSEVVDFVVRNEYNFLEKHFNDELYKCGLAPSPEVKYS